MYELLTNVPRRPVTYLIKLECGEDYPILVAAWEVFRSHTRGGEAQCRIHTPPAAGQVKGHKNRVLLHGDSLFDGLDSTRQ